MKVEEKSGDWRLERLRTDEGGSEGRRR